MKHPDPEDHSPRSWSEAGPPLGSPFSSSPRALCTGGLDPRDLKTALFCISFLRKGEVLAYVGRMHNLEDLKVGADFDPPARSSLPAAHT